MNEPPSRREIVSDAGTAPSFDVEARMRQVLGEPQRVEPVKPEDLSEEQLQMIMRLRAGAGTTKMDDIPQFFLVAVKHPRLFQCQVEAGTMYYTGLIPPRDRELAILRVAWLCRAPFEWGEHVPIAKRHGITAEQIERATQGSDAPGWSEHDAAILRGVEELLDDKMLSNQTWDILAKTWSEPQMMEFPMLIGAYVGTAFQQNTLRMRLGPNNIGLTAR
jgi:hypothetical protein